jgi:hypothetical protein
LLPRHPQDEQRAGALPPHYLSPPPLYHAPGTLVPQLIRQCRRYLNALAENSAPRTPAASPPVSVRTDGVPSPPVLDPEDDTLDLQDVDWENSCEPIDHAAPSRPSHSLPPASPPPMAHAAPTPGPGPLPFDPLDADAPPGPEDVSTGCVARQAQRLYRLSGRPAPSVTAISMADPLPPGLAVSPDDHDLWEEQGTYFLSLIRLADEKAVEFKVDYHRAVLEVEAKHQQVQELTVAVAQQTKDKERLKDELATVRSSYDRQLALLSDRLADLTGRRGGAPTTKRH